MSSEIPIKSGSNTQQTQSQQQQQQQHPSTKPSMQQSSQSSNSNINRNQNPNQNQRGMTNTRNRGGNNNANNRTIGRRNNMNPNSNTNNNGNMSLFRDLLFDSPIERAFKSFLGNDDNDYWMEPFQDMSNTIQTLSSSFKCDVIELPNMYQVKADLPGMNKNNINITFNKDGELEIEGKREESKEWDEDEGHIHHKELNYGSFHRTFYLPKSIGTDISQVKAKYENGELRIQVPKIQQSSNRVNIE